MHIALFWFVVLIWVAIAVLAVMTIGLGILVVVRAVTRRVRRIRAKRAIRKQLQLIRNERAGRPVFTGHGYLEERRKHQPRPVERQDQGDNDAA